MLCKNCGKRAATTHIKRTINGQTQEYFLCAECAQQLGLGSINPFEMSDLWGSLFGSSPEGTRLTAAKRCATCGSSFAEITKRGRLGCPECYKEFYEQLLPSIRKMHGKTNHVGKVPDNADETAKRSYRLSDLKKQLKEAVDSEEFERAASLRDEIKAVESEVQDNE